MSCVTYIMHLSPGGNECQVARWVGLALNEMRHDCLTKYLLLASSLHCQLAHSIYTRQSTECSPGYAMVLFCNTSTHYTPVSAAAPFSHAYLVTVPGLPITPLTSSPIILSFILLDGVFFLKNEVSCSCCCEPRITALFFLADLKCTGTN